MNLYRSRRKLMFSLPNMKCASVITSPNAGHYVRPSHDSSVYSIDVNLKYERNNTAT